MATTYSTKFDRAKVIKSLNGLSNVIERVAYTVYATSDDGYVKAYKKMIDFPQPNPSTFVNINEVTEAMLIQWIEAQADYLTADDKQAFEFRLQMEREKLTYEDYKFSFMSNDDLRFNLIN